MSAHTPTQIYVTCAGLAMFISLVAPQQLAQLAGVLAVLSFMMLSGAAPTLEQLKANLLFPKILWVGSFFSLFRWSQELYYIVAVRPYNPGPGGTLAYYGYKVRDRMEAHEHTSNVIFRCRTKHAVGCSLPCYSLCSEFWRT